MSDPSKISMLTQLVNSSSILNAQEKAEWLALMDLMNDKQLAELEEILQNSSPASVNTEASVAAPTLSHISNLPSQMVDPRVSPKPQPQSPFRQPAESRESISEPTIPPASSTSAISPEEKQFIKQTRLAPLTSGVTPTTSNGLSASRATLSKPRSSQSASTALSLPGSAEAKPQSIAESNQSSEESSPKFQLLSLSDIETLTADVLHHQNRSAFYSAIMALAQKFGYFRALSSIEQSPLYQDYMDYGRLLLANQTNTALPLTQEEFEFVADLLSALKINRV
ncbi:MAG TPA: hypothetical protein PKD79_00725 [Candidatus Doudnabacteria bacterium]|nr:hypothetical protein [Candidatus Doudnabacteria bacterium]